MPRKSRLERPLEWYPWNPLQWQSSRRVQRMTWEEKGIYRELLDECYLKGCIPSTPSEIAALLGEDLSIIGHALPRIMACFELRADGFLYNAPIEAIREEQLERRLERAERRLRAGKHPKEETDEDHSGPLGTTADLTGPHGTTEEVHGPHMRSAPQTGPLGQDRTGQDSKEETKAKEVSPRGATSGRRPRKGSVDAFMATDIPKAVIESALRLFAKWDKTDPDGREIKPDFNLMVPRMADILAKHPTLTLEVLEAGAMDYLEYKAKRRKAPQFYFGSQPPEGADKPLWRSYAEAAYMKQKLSQTQPQAPEPTPEHVNG